MSRYRPLVLLLGSTIAVALLAGCPSPASAPDAAVQPPMDATSPGPVDSGPTDAGAVAADAEQPGPADSGAPPDAGTVPGPDAGSSRSADLADLCGPIAEWECARAASCGCTKPSGEALEAAWCKQVREAACEKELKDGLQGLGDGLSQGLVVVRTDKVPGCVAALEAGSPPCTKSSLAFVAGCFDTLEISAVGAGQSCPWPGIPCGDGTHCTSTGCAAPKASGEACQESGQCASRYCAQNLCADLESAGAACGSPYACKPPLVCLDGHCAALGGLDAACADTSGCEPPLECASGKCAAVATCTGGEPCGNEGRCVGPVSSACREAGPAGTTCTLDSQCQLGVACDWAAGTCAALPETGACLNGASCAQGFGCDMTTTTCTGLGGEGSACLLSSDGPFLCAPGLVCSATDSTCILEPKEGDPCGMPNDCGGADADFDGVSDLACSFEATGSVCVKRRSAGDPCQNEVCAAGLFCDYGVGSCRAFFALGAPCRDGNECGPDRTCMPDDLMVLRCQALPATGEPCFFDCIAGDWCERAMTSPTCRSPICVAMFQLQ